MPIMKMKYSGFGNFGVGFAYVLYTLEKPICDTTLQSLFITHGRRVGLLL